MSLPEPAISLLEAQLGVVARRQLRRWLGAQPVDDLLRGPRFDRLERGVHRLRGSAGLPEQRAIAAALRVGEGAVLTGPVVLSRYGLDGFSGDHPFEVLVPPGRRLRGITFRHRRDPDPRRATGSLGEVALASPVDALIDSGGFAGEVGERALRLGYDQLRWRGLVTPARLTSRIAQLGPGAPGGAALLELFDLAGLEPESDGERGLGVLLQRFDPRPEPQVWVTPSRRVDWYFRAVRYGYEYLGSVDHARVSGRLDDDRRDAELRREGIRLGYVTAADLRDEASLLAAVAGALSVRAHELGTSPPVLRPV